MKAHLKLFNPCTDYLCTHSDLHDEVSVFSLPPTKQQLTQQHSSCFIHRTVRVFKSSFLFPAFLTVKVIFGDSWPTSNCCSSSAPAAGSGSPTLFSSCFWSFLSPHSSSSSSPSSSSSTFCSFLFHSFSAERRGVMERREEERSQANGETNTWQEAGIIRI